MRLFGLFVVLEACCAAAVFGCVTVEQRASSREMMQLAFCAGLLAAGAGVAFALAAVLAHVIGNERADAAERSAELATAKERLRQYRDAVSDLSRCVPFTDDTRRNCISPENHR